MKRIAWWLSLAVVAMLFSSAPVTQAQEPERRLMERMERLEQHVQRLTAAMEHEKHQRMERPEGPRGPMPPRPGMEGPRPPKPPPVCPVATPGAARCLRCAGRVLLAVLAVLHILLAVWVYGDVQKRGVPGRAVFIVLVLLGGIPMSILYALVRIGDKVGEKTS